jgi:uncharacterized membrane protein YeaQ/YmgE (transglycosylase-associated protein family)
MYVVSLIIVGLIVGALGRLLHPGRDRMGILRTLVVGVASVLIAGLIIGGWLGFVVAVLIGVGLVSIWARLFERPRQTPRWRRALHG